MEMEKKIAHNDIVATSFQIIFRDGEIRTLLGGKWRAGPENIHFWYGRSDFFRLFHFHISHIFFAFILHFRFILTRSNFVHFYRKQKSQQFYFSILLLLLSLNTYHSAPSNLAHEYFHVRHAWVWFGLLVKANHMSNVEMFECSIFILFFFQKTEHCDFFKSSMKIASLFFSFLNLLNMIHIYPFDFVHFYSLSTLSLIGWVRIYMHAYVNLNRFFVFVVHNVHIVVLYIRIYTLVLDIRRRYNI